MQPPARGRERKSKRQRGAQVAKTSPDEVDPIGWAFQAIGMGTPNIF